MQLTDFPAETKQLGLRAMKAVAAANGVFADEEASAIHAAAHALGVTVDAAKLTAAAPAEVAAALTDPLWRERLVQALIVMAMIDGEITDDEVAVVRSFADALGVDEPRIRSMRHLIDGHLQRVRIDFARRAPLPKQMLAASYEKEGLKGVWKFLRASFRHPVVEPELAWRFKRLGLLPEGTLGRSYWAHMTEQKFAFPGEPDGIAEVGVHHDMTHVLTGYDTDPAGETQIASFYAGYFKTDPFSFVFMVLLLFQLGLDIAPGGFATPAKGKFDPELVVRAMQRGARMTVDLTDHWDYWKVVDKPIDDVRRMYGLLD